MRVHLFAASLSSAMFASPPTCRAEIATTRVEGLVNAWQIMCFIDEVDFDRSSQKAAAMQLRVLTDIQPPPINGVVVRSKTWLMGLTDGPLAFSVSDAKGVPRPLKICSITAPDVTVAEMRVELMKQLHQGEPRPLPGQNGGDGAGEWDFPRLNAKLVLRNGIFKPQPGFMLIYEVSQKGPAAGERVPHG